GKAAQTSIELAQLHRLPDIPLLSTIPPLLDPDLFTFQEISYSWYNKVPLSVVKDCLPQLPILTDLINSSFTTSVFPRALKKAEVISQPKDGDQEIDSTSKW
ncbi:Hypothetical predicted protein, partial [Paramuricea clavata]